MYGQNGDDTLDGGAGNDRLDGGSGADVMSGGTGNDIYHVDILEDVIIEEANAGDDSVISTIDYVLEGENLENVEIIGNALSVTGNLKDNVLIGNMNDNVIDGNTGKDTMIGNKGNDTYYIDNSEDKVVEVANEGNDSIISTVDYQLSEGVEVESLTIVGNATTLVGNELDNSLYGNELNNILLGNAGNDELNGGIGIDVMKGGIGNDIYYIDNTNDVVTENTSEGYDTVIASTDYALSAHVEELILVDDAISAIGNSADNIVKGNELDNYIDGKKGADTMFGGAGDDYYVVDQYKTLVTNDNGVTTLQQGDQVIEDIQGNTGGIDTIEQWGNNKVYREDSEGNWTETGSYRLLQNNVENLILKGEAGTAFGNGLDNVITLNEQDNFANGLGGDDTIIYQKGGGQDTISVSDYVTAVDTLVIQGYSQEESFLTREQDNLMIRFADSEEHIWIIGYFKASKTEDNGEVTDGKVDRIIFENNEEQVVLTQQDIDNAIIDRADNHAPTINKHPRGISINDDETLSFQFDADTIVDQDAWDANLDYRLTLSTKNSDGSFKELPDWLNFDKDTLTLTGNPSADDIGNYQFILWAGDLFNNSMGAYFELTVDSSEPEDIPVTPTDPTTPDSPTDDTDLSGNDTLTDTSGNDHLQGGAGNDTYVYSAGRDTITDTQGIDTLTFSNGITFGQVGSGLMKSGNDLVLRVNGSTSNQVTLKDYFTNADSIIETINFETGGSISHNQIFGLFGIAIPKAEVPTPTEPETPTDPETPVDDIDLSGDNTITDTAGDDQLKGGSGNDIYIYTQGQDTIVDTHGIDEIVFSNGITFNQVGSGLMSSGNDLILRVNGNANNQVTIKDYFSNGDSIIETIRFETGGSISHEQIFGLFGKAIPESTPAEDTTPDVPANSDGTADILGTDSNDQLQGSEVDNRLQGRSGNDQLDGGLGNDILIGGTGNDLLKGNAGDDLYYFEAGFGQDIIDNIGGGIDNIYFDGVGFNQIASGLMRSNDDLILKVSGTADQLTIQDFFMGGESAVGSLSFASGGSISADQIFGAYGISNPDPANASRSEHQTSLGVMLDMMQQFDENNMNNGSGDII